MDGSGLKRIGLGRISSGEWLPLLNLRIIVVVDVKVVLYL
jgi:hypothetical protein